MKLCLCEWSNKSTKVAQKQVHGASGVEDLIKTIKRTVAFEGSFKDKLRPPKNL